MPNLPPAVQALLAAVVHLSVRPRLLQPVRTLHSVEGRRGQCRFQQFHAITKRLAVPKIRRPFCLLQKLKHKAMDDRIQKLELKITELENKLKGMGTTGGGSSSIDPEEFKTYQKVSAQLTPQICSVCSTCSVCVVCVVCRVCRVCQVCIQECSCGPCIMSQGGGFSDAGFGGFM